MKILTGAESQEALQWFEKAAEMATQSLCLRRKCGAVVVKDNEIIGRGFNAPPQNNTDWRTCCNEYEIPAGFRHDRTCCIHAEQRSIADAMQNKKDMTGARIYFIDVDENGDMHRANDLKCTVCSRAVLDAGIGEFALYSENGIRIYPTDEFDRLSYQYKTPRIN